MSTEFIEKKLKESYDAHAVDNILSGLSCKRKTTFRANRVKASFEDIESSLLKLDIEYDTHPDFPDAFILKNYDTSKKRHFDTKTSISIEELAMYKDGKIYMQSLSSMKPVYVLEPNDGDNILDMCAAPGGKTTMIQSITNNKVNLTACELHKDRFEKLKYNIDLQGANVYALNQNACDLNDMLKFDKILIDAPCTGTGTIDIFDKNEGITFELLKRTTNAQMKLIKKAYRLIKKGGMVVYSTCSLLKDENEDIVDFAKSIGFKKIECIKIMPDEIFEGFFIAKLTKD